MSGRAPVQDRVAWQGKGAARRGGSAACAETCSADAARDRGQSDRESDHSARRILCTGNSSS
eukprot:6181910-Pleurochrysis_carterae.AAC.2